MLAQTNLEGEKMYELIIYLAKSKGVLSLKDLEDITGLDKEELQEYIKDFHVRHVS
ncbi:hypothetical protein Dtur_0540 [Dictyoglomus turgidum DSM 6724]|jgi:hypothetical protein|uniref:SMC-Scp complex subunit ScpB n=1 Tax=Dictyoglomus turgidum (strain DSM 6724 / Z-1310) TaxID=515635 RepID=B8DZ97_DICTD|nr:hypothetical protein Dtur_0540 [Dictyoglomus turgidum DSM 6724]HBU31315.1 hypothetical protein [Dictyoglomus sp.]